MTEKKLRQKADDMVNFLHEVQNVYINVNDHRKSFTRNLKISKSMWRIIIISFLFILAVGIFTIPYIMDNYRANRSDNILQALQIIYNTAYDNGDFLSGAAAYHEAAILAKDIDEYALFLSMEAYMYLLHTNSKEYDENYINRALIIINSLKKFGHSDYSDQNNLWLHYFILSIESECYASLDVPLEDQKWKQTITELEDFAGKTSIGWEHPYAMLIFEVMYDTLARYFKNYTMNIVDSIENDSDSYNDCNDNNAFAVSLLCKMEKYQQLYVKYRTFAENYLGLRPDVYPEAKYKEILYDFYKTKVSLNIALGEKTTSPESRDIFIKKLDNIAEECHSKLENMNFNLQNQTSYIIFHQIIAHCLSGVYSIYSKYATDVTGEEREYQEISDKAEKYAQTCRDIVAGLLRLPDIKDEYDIYIIFEASLDMFYVDSFTKDDVEYYFEYITKFLDTKIYQDSSLVTKQEILFLIGKNCKKILEKQGYNEKAYKLGLECAQNLYKYFHVVKNYRGREQALEIHSYFTKYEK